METKKMRRARRRYLLEFSVGMAVYTATVFASAAWLRANAESPWRLVIALVPLLPIAVTVVALIRFYLQQDELQKRQQVESLAFAFVGSSFLVITYGFRETAGFPRVTVWWVWVVMATLWLIRGGIARLRYR
jgi:hypothetical protein